MDLGMRKTILALLLFSLLLTGSFATDCNTDDVKAGFSNGGWIAAYGKRQWDGQSTATAAAAVASILGGPATAAAAAEFLRQMIQEQLAGAARALKEAGGDAAEEALKRLATNLISGGSATEGIGTLDIKAAIIRVSCKNCITIPCPTWRNPGRTCPKCVASEGYFQIAVAFRPR